MTPYSTRLWDSRIPEYVKKLSEKHWKLTILDVWAWAGKRAKLLKDHYALIDAVEIFGPYIEEFKLDELYSEIYNIDIMDFDPEEFGSYDLVILWDILEHLSIHNAQILIERLKKARADVFVMVPFETEQWECYDNIYETHLQPDLTEEVMDERYPELEKVFVEWRFWFYKLKY